MRAKSRKLPLKKVLPFFPKAPQRLSQTSAAIEKTNAATGKTIAATGKTIAATGKTIAATGITRTTPVRTLATLTSRGDPLRGNARAEPLILAK